jgi:cytochrome c oxidase subunit 3
MSTVINPSPLTQDPRSNGSNGGNADPSIQRVMQHPQRTSSTGISIGLCAIAMSFAALTSAMIVRKGSNDWKHIDVPWLLYLNTVVLIASSATLEVGRRRVARFMRTAGTDGSVHPARWLEATLALGLAFLAGQLIAWHQLAERGFYVATNPSSSFFYVLTAGHALHLFGGLFGLVLVLRRLSGPVPSLRKSTIDAATYYWHFMGVLWVYLLLLLRFQL